MSELEAQETFETVLQTADDDTREFQDVMLRAAFMTYKGDDAYSTYYAGYVEFGESSINEAQDTVQDTEYTSKAEVDGSTVHYTYSSSEWAVSLGYLPSGFTLNENNDEGIHTVSIYKDGESVGGIVMYPFGTSVSEELEKIDTASNELPMQIYSTIALSNVVNYANGYEVVSCTSTGSNAVAYPTDQNSQVLFKCVYAYDYSKLSYFAVVSFDTDSITDEELTEIARSLRIS